jgi:hypothetical protein
MTKDASIAEVECLARLNIDTIVSYESPAAGSWSCAAAKAMVDSVNVWVNV